jgi:subtilisin family serine protease
MSVNMDVSWIPFIPLDIYPSNEKKRFNLNTTLLSRRRALNRWASGFIPSGLQRNVYDPQTGYTTVPAGITGERQVVNVADTGVHFQNVFFCDANHSLESVTSRANCGHRKIVRIHANVDYKGGHGTHVCGTVAGEAYCAAAPRGTTASASTRSCTPRASGTRASRATCPRI